MKKLTSAFLAASMVASMSATSFAAGDAWGESGEIGGDSAVMNPVISFSLPTDLDFSLDAFGMGDATGSTIFSPEFKIVNNSEVAIRVAVKASLTAAEGVTLKSSVADVKVDDPTVTTKDVYMELVAQEVLTHTATITDGALSDVAVTATAISYDPADADHPGAVTPAKAVLAATPEDGAKPTVMTLALSKATYDDASPTHKITAVSGKTGAAVVRFAGTINPNVPTWTANDVSVKAVFDVSGLTGTVYDKLITSNAELDPDLKKANVASVGASSAAGANVTIDTFSAGSTLTFTVVMGSGDNKLASLTSANLTGIGAVDAYLTFDASAGTLVASQDLQGAASAGTLTLVFATEGGGEETFTLTLA